MTTTTYTAANATLAYQINTELGKYSVYYDVVDSEANILANLSGLDKMYGELRSLTFTDAPTVLLALTPAQYEAGEFALMVTGNYSITVSGARADDAPIFDSPHLTAVSVVDSAANVSAHLSYLSAVNLSKTKITLTDSGPVTFSISGNQWSQDSAVFSAIEGSDFTVSVTSGVEASSVANIGALPYLSTIAVSDNSYDIGLSLDTLESAFKSGKLSSITMVDNTPFSIEYSQIAADADVLKMLPSSYKLDITSDAADATAAVNGVHTSYVVIADSAAGISAHIDSLEPLFVAGQITQIFQTDSNPLSLSAVQLTFDAPVLKQLGDYEINETGVLIGQAAALLSEPRIAEVGIADYAAAINANIATLQSLAESHKISSISVIDGGTIQFPYSSFSSFYGLPSLLTGDYGVSLSGVYAGSAVSVLAQAHVVSVGITDSAADIGASLDTLQSLVSSNKVVSIALTDSATPTLSITASQLSSDAQALHEIASPYRLAITGSAASLSSSLDVLQSLAAAGKLSSITLSDSASATLSVSATQLTSDATALFNISGTYSLDVTATPDGGTIVGSLDHATIVNFPGNASDYTLATGANGAVTVTSVGGTEHLSGIDAIQIGALTDIVAPTPLTGGAANSGNLIELYGAIFSRTPDLAGLSFYETYLAANPNTSLLQFATWFLDSSEYQNNKAHNYAQTTAGEAQFITDSYQNLLHRTPSADEVTFYLTKVIQPSLTGLTVGTDAYKAADLQAHAQMLVYFSGSQEFLSDVQITAQNPSSAQHWLLLTS